GMTVDPHTAKYRADHEGHPYYFCSGGCRTKFAANPEKYLGAREPEPVAEGAIYTCRFWIGLALTLPVFVLEMGAHIAGAHNWVDPALSNYIQFAFATPVVLWAGAPFFVRGWQSLVTGNLNMFTLIAMGTGVAYVYSVAATFAPGMFP